MKKTIFFIFIMMLCSICTGCTTEYSDGSKTISSNYHYEEWISPDGVHYWKDGYKLAPRYDNNGNLVIDKLN